MRQRTAVARSQWLHAIACGALCMIASTASAEDASAAIGRVKGSIVAIGTYQGTRTPAFQFRGTGFVVGDGTLVATNAHVLPGALDASRLERLGVLEPGSGDKVRFREAKQAAIDTGSDLVVLRIGGDAMPALRLRDSDSVKEGQAILFTGFPIGAALGPYPATHRGMVSAITPIAIAQARSADLNPQVVRRLATGSFPVFQLDATAYPGSSGSPIYDPESAEVLGIVNMVFVKGTKETALTQPSGITYAIPANHLRDLLQRVRP